MGGTQDPELRQNKLFMVETCPFVLTNNPSFHVVVLENKLTIFPKGGEPRNKGECQQSLSNDSYTVP
jgi:hypothetical protein